MQRLFIILFVLVHSFGFAQETKDSVDFFTPSAEKIDEIKVFFDQYYQYTLEKDFDKILDQIYPELFELAPKEFLKQQFEAAFNNENIHFTFDVMSFENVAKSFHYDGVAFYISNYHSVFSMEFTKDAEQTDQDFETYLETLESMYSAQFQGDSVYRNKNVIQIDGEKSMLVIDNSLYDGLKILELKPGMKNIYKMFLPQIVLDQISDYIE